MLRLYTGRGRLLESALVKVLSAAEEETLLVVVPKQLTLQTERMLLRRMNLRGSFRLQVISAERLCGRIFDAVGRPEGERIDDRGRVMLVRAAVRAASEQLTIYRDACRRRGFPERAAKQLERFRQAGLSPDALRACAEELRGAAAMKLTDLSYILEAYESLIAGRYQDGEAEFMLASARVRDAAFLRSASVWFYGFDMIPPTLGDFIVAVSAACGGGGLFFALENDTQARDFDAFLPLSHALDRLRTSAERMGCGTERVFVEETPRPGGMCVEGPARAEDLARLERELFAFPAEPSPTPARAVQLTMLRSPLEECMFAAALTRRLVRARGWRYGDVLILCRDIDAYAAPLRTAFARYGVPLFLSSSRSAARHATAECLLTALRCVEKGFAQEDVLALADTGLMPVTRGEAERLANYAVRWGLRGTRFLRPLRRGSEAEIDALEPVRARLVAPLVKLRDALRKADDLDGQLKAMFGFLTDVGAYGKSVERMRRLSDAGMREAAGEEGQVWNRILGALDQMHELMGTKRLSVCELSETLSESLSASVVKSLPQSADAAYAQSMEAACTQPVRAILILGASDSPVSDDEGLLTPAQKRAVSKAARAYLGPDDADLSRLRRYYLKSALGMATDYVSVSCALSGADGAAQRPSAMFGMIEALFPNLSARGGVTGDASVDRMLRGAPGAAVLYAAKALGAGERPEAADLAALAGLSRLAEGDEAVRADLSRLRAALSAQRAADELNPETARALYGALHRQSVTRLERFAACPFSYFVRYGLKPDEVEPFELSARDEGTFFHAAVNEFLLRSMEDLQSLDAQSAAARMDGIADAMLGAMIDAGPLGDSAVALAERRRLKATARMCAVALADHMRGSRFYTAALEQNFGREDGDASLALPCGCTLEGRIDRVDAWEDYLRVIDYKRGGKALRIDDVRQGKSLQLPVYLAAALKKRGARSAGVYYFNLGEGILATQSLDWNDVEQQRRKAFRMEGLLPSDREVLMAMSPNFTDVVKARVSASGELYKDTPTATEAQYRELIDCALGFAEDYIRRIRQGECGAVPGQMCAWCTSKAACRRT